MSNTYFRFKQFTVHQDKCAMKVSTDACILGAWAPVSTDVKMILDIGTGTGLLTLMLAQRSDAEIHGIELDDLAAGQALENIQQSLWRGRIEIIHGDATTYQFPGKYDLLISNPPFFNNSLLGSNAQRNNARHTLTLTYQHVFDIIRDNIAEGGEAVILLPVEGLNTWKDILTANNWHIATLLEIYPKKGAIANRVIGVCKAGQKTDCEVQYLFIRETGNEYTEAFQELLSPYYLDK